MQATLHNVQDLGRSQRGIHRYTPSIEGESAKAKNPQEKSAISPYVATTYNFKM